MRAYARHTVLCLRATNGRMRVYFSDLFLRILNDFLRHHAFQRIRSLLLLKRVDYLVEHAGLACHKPDEASIQRDTDAMIGDSPLWEIVRANPLRAVGRHHSFST